jgi:hypothetical protein
VARYAKLLELSTTRLSTSLPPTKQRRALVVVELLVKSVKPLA